MLNVPDSNGTEGLSSGLVQGTCLVVDDSAMVRKIARRLLSGLGFAIEEAEDGQKALDQCIRKMPNAVLLDWNMPVMDGLQFLIALRAAEGGNAPAVVFCTTESDVEHITAALDAGADEYLIKPFDKLSLEIKMGAALQARSSVQ